MKRLGFFTGKIYDETIDTASIKECCLYLTKDNENNEEYIAERKADNKQRCMSCFGCPISKEGE